MTKKILPPQCYRDSQKKIYNDFTNLIFCFQFLVGPSFEKPLPEKSDGIDGENVVLEVKVKGIPAPDVTWMKVKK